MKRSRYRRKACEREFKDKDSRKRREKICSVAEKAAELLEGVPQELNADNALDTALRLAAVQSLVYRVYEYLADDRTDDSETFYLGGQHKEDDDAEGN